ncbi:MAG: (2E,6E)-farnesyl diphosphate synthase [Gammaproteobacteria bacterium]|nr:(2E,6E)-farnesyl diphosphate synthase [Gammaproteobacteria bacterium]
MSWQDFTRSHLLRINHHLDQYFLALPATAPRLASAMRHGTLIGGKRMRPLLVYAVGSLNGTPLAQLDDAAAAIELIHAYSLVHDDLPAMDDDDLRRGQPTCHVAYDEATAILAGDALQTEAFSLLANARGLNAEQRLALVATLAQASGYAGMCGGQALDLAATGATLSVDALIQVHRHKTGALIRAAVQMGAICANLPVAERDALDRYADAVGLAFQVHDDVLDETADTATLGKPQGSDKALNKSTFVAHLGIDGARDHARELVQQALHALAAIPYNTAILAALASYAIERTH